MSALASFGELLHAVAAGTIVVGALWTVAMLGIDTLLDPFREPLQLSVMPDMDWISLRHGVAFVAGLVAIDVVLVVGGLSRTTADGLAMAPLIALMWYVISVFIDLIVTAAIGDTTSTQPEVLA